MKKNKIISTVLFALLFTLSSCQTSQKSNFVKSAQERSDVSSAQAVGTEFAVATQGKYTTQAAERMFALGGNIIDAVVAASFTVSVERPQSSGIGGGGFMLFHEAKSGKTYAIDFRERAPLKATESMYQDKSGKADLSLSRDGILSVAVPGMVAGLLEIHKRFGSLSLDKVMAPSIELAEKGFPIYAEFHEALKYRESQLRKDLAAKKIFLTSQGDVPALGSLLIQKDLANTLKGISKKGSAGFYKGSVAKSIVEISKKKGGILSQKDLDTYQVKWREPVEGEYHGYHVYSMPPPSSGGIHVIQFLNFLENDSLSKAGILSQKSIHLAASALQSAFADRATYLGDPDFVKVPVKELTSPDYIKSRRAEVNLKKARKADEVKAGDLHIQESSETTHLSLIDAQGNAVATTQTVNGWMGSGMVAPGTGIVLNNEMDDFSAQVGTQNIFGAVGGQPNAIAPRKTPLSSMSPTILMKDNKPALVLGAPGGTRIISCVAQTILNYVEFGESLYDSVAAIRYHHQWKPDTLVIENPGPGPEVMKGLQDMGYDVSLKRIGCNVMAVAREGDKLRGVADPRDIGTSAAK